MQRWVQRSLPVSSLDDKTYGALQGLLVNPEELHADHQLSIPHWCAYAARAGAATAAQGGALLPQQPLAAQEWLLPARQEHMLQRQFVPTIFFGNCYTVTDPGCGSTYMG